MEQMLYSKGIVSASVLIFSGTSVLPVDAGGVVLGTTWCVQKLFGCP